MAVLSTPLHYLTSVPPVTRYFTLATIVLSSLYLWIWWSAETTYIPYLTLVPGSSLFYPWTFVSSALVEASLWELAFSLIVIPASLRYFERLWGSLEILKFILICVTGPNLIAFAFNWIEYAAIGDANLFLYGMQYHGQMALFTSLLVAFTQIIPEHQVQIFGLFRVRVKRLPMVYMTFSVIMTLLGLQCPYITIQFGWFVSWIYLRFYKRNVTDTLGGVVTYGDRSETFALTSWFPPFLHTPVSALANTIYKIATRLRLVPSSFPQDIESGYSQVPGGARAEAERRRALALKALDQRLAHSSSNLPGQNGPSGQPTRPSPPASAPLTAEQRGSVSEADVADPPGSTESEE